MLIRRAAKDTTPVIILAGFLGAGKTTILNHVLKEAVGARLAVIVNDFGAVNIDSLLITAQTDRKLELTNGCVCCSVGDGELEETLDMALSAKPDAVIIEASGLAEPEDLARLIVLSPNKRLAYGGMVYVVDGVKYDETLQKHPALVRHLDVADLVVVTKTEHVTKHHVDEFLKELAMRTHAPIVTVQRGELAPELLFDIPKRDEVQLSLLQQGDGHSHHHLHDEYQTMTFETSDPIDLVKFKVFMNHPPRGVYRIKGIVYFGVAGYEQKFVVQAVGNKWDMYAEEWSKDEAPRTLLVAIGSSFNIDEALQSLAASVGEAQEFLDLRRYSEN